MLELIFFALFLGFITIFFLKRTTSNIALEKDFEATQSDQEVQALRRMAPAEFERAIKNLLEDMNLRIVETT